MRRHDLQHLAQIIRRAGTGALLVAGALLAASCGEGPTGPSTPISDLPRALSANEQNVVQASNGFAVNLLR
jgi:hypothetical protein